MLVVLVLIAVLLVAASVLGKPQTRLFFKEKVAPFFQRGVQELRRQKNDVARNSKLKIWIYVAIGLGVLLILSLIF